MDGLLQGGEEPASDFGVAVVKSVTVCCGACRVKFFLALRSGRSIHPSPLFFFKLRRRVHIYELHTNPQTQTHLLSGDMDNGCGYHLSRTCMHTYIHTPTHTCIHTYIHTYMMVAVMLRVLFLFFVCGGAGNQTVGCCKCVCVCVCLSGSV
jgi:hypothetical protein